MAYLQVKGLDEYTKKVKKLSDNSEEIIKRAVYKGAGTVADAVKQGINGLPIQQRSDGRPYFARKGEQLTGVTASQKKDLTKSMGLAPIQEMKLGYINTKLGFDGYGSTPTKQYPRGVPNQLLMRGIESGTYFRKKNAVVRRSVNKSRKLAQKNMADTIDEELRKEF